MKILKIVSRVALVLALFVVMLGAYTRLTDAGLGCPDWPGCYGKLVLPTNQNALSFAQKTYPEIPIEAEKAWTEMAHRYVAGVLVLLLGFIIFKTISKPRTVYNIPRKLPIFLLLLIVFQALLGMWTVTFKLLPIVVISHLLGGILIFTCVSFFCWKFSGVRGIDAYKYKKWLNIAFMIVLMQIVLGGLVSANYAGIACIGFPKCSGVWLPNLNFTKAFDLLPGIGANYQGGVLDNSSRVTLQFIHRLGAIITLTYIAFIGLWIFFTSELRILRMVAIFTLLLVCAQFCLGIANVIFLLPLWVAVLHNGFAAVLLAMTISMRYLVSCGGPYVK